MSLNISDPYSPSAQKKSAFGTPVDFFEFFRQFKTGVPREQVIRLAEQTPNNTVVTFTIILLAVILLYSHVDLLWIILWLVLQSSLQTLVILRWRSNKKKYKEPHKLDIRPSIKGLHQSFTWAILSGLIWGGLTIFIPYVPPFQQLALVMIMAGMAAGASSTLAAIPQVSSIFILACTTPSFVFFLTHDEPQYRIMAGMAFIFTGAMLTTSRVVYKSLFQQMLAERRSEKFQTAHFQDKIASIVNAETSPERALSLCLEKVCNYLGWPLGHIYMPEEKGNSGHFTSKIRYSKDPALLENFSHACLNLSTEYDAGLTGMIEKSHKPVWVKDITENPDLLTLHLENGMGIKSAFAFPVTIKDKIVAIFECFSPKTVSVDHELLEFMEPKIGRAHV